MSKIKERKRAISLRKKGLSYSEILREVPVAKSTLSLWLRSVGLAQRYRQRLTEKRLTAALKGAKAKKDQRLAVTKEIKDRAKREIEKISKRELWLIGTALYWAEGAKQKEHNVSQKVKFSNSDPMMIKVFLRWIRDICGIPRSGITFRIALHETAIDRLAEVKKHWSGATGFSINNFQKIDWKKGKINTKRKNIGSKYYGLLNVYIKNSTNLNRKIEGWIEGIYNHCGVV
ncbi:MAG: hypothetical protein Q8P74_02205 [bacterium]|nr:hypothetical protein [bacterium]